MEILFLASNNNRLATILIPSTHTILVYITMAIHLYYRLCGVIIFSDSINMILMMLKISLPERERGNKKNNLSR